MSKPTKVITYSTPRGNSIDITPAQERRLAKAGMWLTDARGEEYCQVRYGLHVGEPTYTDEQIRDHTAAGVE